MTISINPGTVVVGEGGLLTLGYYYKGIQNFRVTASKQIASIGFQTAMLAVPISRAKHKCQQPD